MKNINILYNYYKKIILFYNKINILYLFYKYYYKKKLIIAKKELINYNYEYSNMLDYLSNCKSYSQNDFNTLKIVRNNCIISKYNYETLFNKYNNYNIYNFIYIIFHNIKDLQKLKLLN